MALTWRETNRDGSPKTILFADSVTEIDTVRGHLERKDYKTHLVHAYAISVEAPAETVAELTGATQRIRTKRPDESRGLD